MISETHTCPQDSRYKVCLDLNEVIPDDPGQGTPAMVYGPSHASSTFDCAVSVGVLVGDDADIPIPPRVLRWLESIAEYVESYVDAATDIARLNARTATPKG